MHSSRPTNNNVYIESESYDDIICIRSARRNQDAKIRLNGIYETYMFTQLIIYINQRVLRKKILDTTDILEWKIDKNSLRSINFRCISFSINRQET